MVEALCLLSLESQIDLSLLDGLSRFVNGTTLVSVELSMSRLRRSPLLVVSCSIVMTLERIMETLTMMIRQETGHQANRTMESMRSTVFL